MAAEYVIKNLRTGITFFVFVDEDKERWFCRSVFQLNSADYTTNQTRVTVLKRKNGKTVRLSLIIRIRTINRLTYNLKGTEIYQGNLCPIFCPLPLFCTDAKSVLYIPLAKKQITNH